MCKRKRVNVKLSISFNFTGRKKADDDADFELLDLTDRGWLKKMFGDLTKASVAKQIAVGGASGWWVQAFIFLEDTCMLHDGVL